MREVIKEKGRKYIMEGIMKDIVCFVTEQERHTFLGSTDRKGYTIRTDCRWLEEQVYTYTDIHPFDEKVPELLKRIEEDSKWQLAKKVYEKHYESLTPHNV